MFLSFCGISLRVCSFLSDLTPTGCPRRNVPDFGKMFLMLKYTDITQNTYIQSWTVTEIMAREKCVLLVVPRTVLVKPTHYPYTVHVRPWEWNAVTLCVRYEWLVTCMELQKCLLCFPTWNIVSCILYMDFALAMHVLLLTNTKGVFPDWVIPSRGVFSRIHQTMRETGCLPSVVVQSEREVVQTINTQENILEMVQRSPRLSTRRMASHLGVSRMQVWRTLREEVHVKCLEP